MHSLDLILQYVVIAVNRKNRIVYAEVAENTEAELYTLSMLN